MTYHHPDYLTSAAPHITQFMSWLLNRSLAPVDLIQGHPIPKGHSDLKRARGHQDSSPNNGHQATCPTDDYDDDGYS